MIALSIAALLAVFLLYTSLAGGGTPAIGPGDLARHSGQVQLSGKVVGPLAGSARSPRGLRFRLEDVEGTASVRVIYRGSVPDQFRAGRSVYLDGTLRNGVFVAEPGSLVTKCPSKYTASRRSEKQ